MDQKHGPGLAAWFERRLHDLEQAATGEGGELQLRVLRSADLRAGDRAIPPATNAPFSGSSNTTSTS